MPKMRIGRKQPDPVHACHFCKRQRPSRELAQLGLGIRACRSHPGVRKMEREIKEAEKKAEGFRAFA